MPRYVAGRVSTQLMLKSLFELVAMTADDPDGQSFVITKHSCGDIFSTRVKYIYSKPLEQEACCGRYDLK